jgi:hypothetical protein
MNTDKLPDSVAAFYKIDSCEAGIISTGSRAANYHCYCEIYDADKKPINKHHLSDVFYGRWSKCFNVINKWRKRLEKTNLQQLNTPPNE